MPRFNVCKVRSDDHRAHGERGTLPQEVTFLMKLKNMRVQRAPNVQTGLTVDELRCVFEDPKHKGYKLTETQWRKVCAQLFAVPVPPMVDVAPPKEGGRSRFCRPALEVMKRLILSGKTPADFHAAELAKLNGNEDPRKGLIPDDLKFLLDMGKTWEGIFVPNQKLDVWAQQTNNSEAAILKLIGAQNDPVVRHRLGVFCQRLKDMQKEHGTPSEIVLEFVREDFMGPKALKDLRDFQKKREFDRKKAREDATAAGATEKSAVLKMELLRMQDGECLYWGTKLIPTKLEQYRIEHIVPRARGGPDAMVNYVLTTHEANTEKADRTPFEWLSATDKWDAFVNRVKARQTVLRNKKVRLLLLPEAAELAGKYTALAETAWIAKLAQTLAGLHFDWKNGVDEQGAKRVTVISGGLTGRIRRKYRLNNLLAGEGVDEAEAEEKNRDDDRHHALDAMVLAFLPGWARDKNKEQWFRFPDPLRRNPHAFLAAEIERVRPFNLCLSSSELEQTAYGERELRHQKFGVGREPLVSLLVRVTNNKESLKAPGKAETHRIVDPVIRRDVTAYLEAHASLTLDEWKQWCGSYRVGFKGARVVKVLMTKTKADALDEYCDVSKDGTQQLRRGEMHRGYFVYWSAAPTKRDPDKRLARVRPVYAFESVGRVKREMKQKGAMGAQFFQSGCTVELDDRVDHLKTPLVPGRYLLNSIWSDGRAKVTSKSGKVSEPINLGELLRAGFRRVG